MHPVETEFLPGAIFPFDHTYVMGTSKLYAVTGQRNKSISKKSASSVFPGKQRIKITVRNAGGSMQQSFTDFMEDVTHKMLVGKFNVFKMAKLT